MSERARTVMKGVSKNLPDGKGMLIYGVPAEEYSSADLLRFLDDVLRKQAETQERMNAYLDRIT